MHTQTPLCTHTTETQTLTHRETSFLDVWKQGLVLLTSHLGLFPKTKLCSFRWLCFPHYFFFNLSKIALQCCISFCCTMKWISYMYTYIKDVCLLQVNKAGMIDCFSAFWTQDFIVDNDPPRIHRSLTCLNRYCWPWSGN